MRLKFLGRPSPPRTRSRDILRAFRSHRNYRCTSCFSNGYEHHEPDHGQYNSIQDYTANCCVTPPSASIEQKNQRVMKLGKIAKYVITVSGAAIISFAGSVLADKDDPTTTTTTTTTTTKHRSHHKKSAEPAASPTPSPKGH